MGFYGTECGNILGLGGAFFAAITGMSLLAGEEGGHTAEFLLTHPLGRTRIAGEKLAAELEHVTIGEIRIPYIANVTADYVTDRAEVKPLLEKQVSSSVRWQQTAERMIADGVDTFVEIGPGKTLSGFMRKISRDVKVVNVERVEDLEKLNDLL